MPRPHRSDAERFEMKVDRSAGPDACHPWTGAWYRKGYGHFTVPQMDGTTRHVTASKYVLEQKLGRLLEKGEVAEHECDNPPCQNPRHIRLGTHKSNAADRDEKGRRGSQRRRLSPEIVVAIRHAVVAGVKVASLACQYGVTSDAVYLAAWGKTWPNAGGPITPHITRKKA